MNTPAHPLSPTAGIAARLLLAGAVITVVWLAVYWALA
jgi:hypothetical protein